MNVANVSAYETTTHSSSDWSASSERWMDGSATFTTVLSSMIMNSPNETETTVHHLRFSGAKRWAAMRARTVLS